MSQHKSAAATILDRIDLLKSPHVRSKLMAERLEEIANFLAEKGPCDKYQIHDGLALDISVETLCAATLRIGKQLELFDSSESDGSSSLYEWRFNCQGAEELRRQFPKEKNLAADEIRNYLADIHKYETGMSALWNNRMVHILAKLADGPLSGDEIARLVGLKYGQQILVHLRIAKRHGWCDRVTTFCEEKTSNDKRPQGAALWKQTPGGIKAFPGDLAEKPETRWPFYQLAAADRRQLELVHWAEAGLTATQLYCHHLASSGAEVEGPWKRSRKRLRNDIRGDAQTCHASHRQRVCRDATR